MIVVICGSMRFLARMRLLAGALEAQGHTALLPAPAPVGIDPERLAPADAVRSKAAFVAAHLDAIRGADAVLVANYDVPPIAGYVGPSAFMELAFGYALGKQTYLLQEIGEQPCRLEVLAMRPSVLAFDVR